MSAPVREASVRSCLASGGNDKTPVDCPADLRPDCPSPLPGKMTPDNSTREAWRLGSSKSSLQGTSGSNIRVLAQYGGNVTSHLKPLRQLII